MNISIGIFSSSFAIAKMIKDMVLELGTVNIYENLEAFFETYHNNNILIIDKTFEDTTAFDILKNLPNVPYTILLTSDEYKKSDYGNYESNIFSFVLKKPFKRGELKEAISFVLKLHSKDFFKNNDILIVDDSSVSRNIIKKYVKLLSFNPIEASNGKDALEYLKEHLETSPVLVITDQEMPGMNGLVLANEIRKLDLYDDMPIIMISGASNDLALKEQALANGISDFIQKPFNEQTLKNILTKYLKQDKLVTEPCKILLVDDSYTQRKAISSMLKSNNINVFNVENLDTGIFLANANNFDILLIDYQLGDNFTAIDFIKKVNNTNIPIIVYSSYKNNFLKEQLDDLFEIGVNDYILMPFQINEVLFKIKVWSEQKKIAEGYEKKLTITNQDYLTGIMLRSAFFEKSEEFFSLARRKNIPLSLLYLDIDHFKRINDSFGHKAGDDILKEFVNIIKGLKRKEDILGRLGGEEFSLLLPYTDLEGAITVAEKIRKTVKEHTFKHNLNITVSIGVSLYNKTITTFDELLNIADKRLYKAKTTGRDKVVYK